MLIGTIFFLLQAALWMYLTFTANLAIEIVIFGVGGCGTVALLLFYMVLVLDKPNGIWERCAAMNEAAERRSKALGAFKRKKGKDLLQSQIANNAQDEDSSSNASI